MGEKKLQSKKNNSEWIKKVALYSSVIKVQDLTDEDKKLLVELFLVYKINGLKPKEALQKAKRVLASFRFQK
jgi:hypothetical protein